jgi:hypothetical protein
MKLQYTIASFLLAWAGTSAAQEVDDMYFTARDRATYREVNQAAMATRYAQEDQQAIRSQPVTPSDTYSGRGVNPEYNAQQKNGTEIIQGNPDYFLASYAPKNINPNLYTGNAVTSSSCGCSSYSGFGNPYGSFYSPYGYSPYSSMGYGSMYSPYGMGYGSSMMVGMTYGMGSMMGSPYGMYSYGYGYGSPYGYAYPSSSAYGYDPIQTTYGRRPVRASSVPASYAYANPGYATGTNGRTRTAVQGSTSYYDSKWRNDPANFPTRSYTSYGRTNYPVSGRSSDWDSSYSGGNQTRSYGSYGNTGGTRSMGGVSGGSSSSSSGGGRSRGRN